MFQEIPDMELLHKNGKIAVMNGIGDDEVTVEAGILAEDVNGQQEEVLVVDVEQQEPASQILDMEPTENMAVVPNDTPSKDIAREDGQVDTTEATDTTVIEEKESPEQPNESQSNEVGFRKVFSFVGFKFTVKKDKTEKSEPVQLLTVKKDEVEVNGTDNHEEPIDAADVGKTETQKETKDVDLQAESGDGSAEAAESPGETPNETQNKTEEAEVEKDQKSPESPTNTVVTDTSSPFKRFFTQGWAGLRKKTSFKKSKEEDPQEVEKHIKSEEEEKAEVPEALKAEEATEKETTENVPVPDDLSKSASGESKEYFKENIENVAAEEPKPEESSSNEPEETIKSDEGIVTVNTERTSAPESNVLSEIKADADTLEAKYENQKAEEISDASPPPIEEINESLPIKASETEVLESQQPQLTSNTECAELEKSQEVITTEADLLSSQEKAKIQGSPLKKLFSSSGLRKLSGKKRKGKKEDDAKEVTAEPAPVSPESSDAAEGDGGDSSPSSPDEAAETSPTAKELEDAPQNAETEEGTTSDGERKKDGITPWASFKKLVTPKRRPKRPSESDKEDEVEKVKTSTLSSTESAVENCSVENQDETKENVEEQKLEKSTEENKKKVDSSVSWEALICVGSSKKRARKTSDSDEEEIHKSQEENKKIEEVVQTVEIDSDSPITNSQEQQIQESSSPDQANSPTDTDGVSTWQSFKRLVTPRRKSRTRAEDKTEETAVVSIAEQSTSEGEAGKEESWVPFRKLIPGRKKKKSDGKQEHTLNNETGQAVNEAVEDDYDEPAVVPLSEFDAAEQEKLDAQNSLEDSVPNDVFGEQQGSLEKPSEELIHAVTISVIEGERAVTSLEERSPSWISADVTDTFEHAKNTEETVDRIKTEVTVEETIVFSTVSQVMSEAQHTLMNEMELTSEALTALEEAIENSCAEETTEMLSAVSQLGESIVSTEEATPVPEEDASMQNLEEQRKHTDNILHAAAEMAKLSVDALNAGNSSIYIINDVPQNLQYEVKADILELQETPCLQKKIEVTSNEKAIENAAISQMEQTVKTVHSAANEQFVVHTFADEQDKESISISTDEILLLTIEKNGGSLLISAEDQLVKEKLESDDVQGDKWLPSLTREQLEKSLSPIEEPATKQNTDENVTVSTDIHPEEVVPLLKERQVEEYTALVAASTNEDPKIDAQISNVEESTEQVHESDEKKPEHGVFGIIKDLPMNVILASSAEQDKDFLPDIQVQENNDTTLFEMKETVPVLPDGQVKEEAVHMLNALQKEKCILVSTDVQFEESAPVSEELQAKESAPVSAEVHAEERTPVSAVTQAEESSPVSAELQAQESAPVSAEVQAEESTPVPAGVQAEESTLMSAEVQAGVSAPASAEGQVEESAPVSAKVHAEDSAPVSAKVHAEDSAPVSAKVHAEESAPVSAEAHAEESASVSVEVHTKESALVQAKESAPVSAEVQAEESTPVSAEVQAEESAPVSAEVQAKESAPVSAEVQAEESAPVSAEVQAEEIAPVSAEVHAEESAPVQAEESAPESAEVHAEESAPVKDEVQAEESASVSDEVQAEESAPISDEVHAEESAPVSAEVHAEESAPVSDEVQAEESASVSDKVQAKESAAASDYVKAVESAHVSDEVKADESASVSAEVHAEESAPVSDEVQDEESAPVSDEVQAEESAAASDLMKAVESAHVSVQVQAEESSPVSAEFKAEEIAPLSAEVKSEVSSSVSSEVQAKESATVSSEVQAKESAPVAGAMKAEESAPVLADVKTEESAPVPAEVQAQETAPVIDELQTEGNTPAEVPAEQNVPTEIKSEVSVPKVKLEEVLVAAKIQSGEDASAELPAVHSVCEIKITDVPSVNEVQDTESVPFVPVAQTEQSVPCGTEEVYRIKAEVGDLQSVTIVDQLTLGHENIIGVKEELITTTIPEFESLEARSSSEPVTAAAVEEQILAETVKPIATTGDIIELVQFADNTRVECTQENSMGLQTVVESVSQKAAAIVDAAIEAATNCFVVDAKSNGDTLEDATVTENGDITEETAGQSIYIESHSIQNVIEVAIEKAVDIHHDNEVVSVTQRQSQENEPDPEVQENVPVYDPIKVVKTVAYREQQNAEGVDESQKEVFVIRVELQTKGNSKKDITCPNQKNQADCVLKNDDHKPSAVECDLPQGSDLVEPDSAQLVQNTKEESKPCVPSYIQEENIQEISTHTSFSEVHTQEKSQTVES
ncbi:A-kinase anchor protein 12 isoform X2 [Pseudophryne corroboree]|uniref:A-kinase anchor protein 12 isoform X2 n=1 Tax=Pseudophryne corroboree TaxID=495146 RepID=UPI003081AD4C